jgi:hypothetical protein
VLVVEFDLDKIDDARGLLEAIYKRDMIAVDPAAAGPAPSAAGRGLSY